MTELNAMQRKALRRISRGQSVSSEAWNDPVIRDCIDTSHYLQPPDLDNLLYPQSMIEWCDWEDRARLHNKPRLNEYGKKLLKELEA